MTEMPKRLLRLADVVSFEAGRWETAEILGTLHNERAGTGQKKNGLMGRGGVAGHRLLIFSQNLN